MGVTGAFDRAAFVHARPNVPQLELADAPLYTEQQAIVRHPARGRKERACPRRSEDCAKMAIFIYVFPS
jgi:hypothetical protein